MLRLRSLRWRLFASRLCVRRRFGRSRRRLVPFGRSGWPFGSLRPLVARRLLAGRDWARSLRRRWPSLARSLILVRRRRGTLWRIRWPLRSYDARRRGFIPASVSVINAFSRRTSKGTRGTLDRSSRSIRSCARRSVRSRFSAARSVSDSRSDARLAPLK